MSTISPAATRRLAARLGEVGVDMLDAPVSGGEAGAIAGTLSIMVGGGADAFARALPLFQVLGRNIVHIGDHGAGQVAKACNQVVIAQTLLGVGEAFLLARASGVDPAKVREALLGGFAGSRVLEVHGQRLLDGNYAPGFKARLHQKDMRIVLEAAADLGHRPARARHSSPNSSMPWSAGGSGNWTPPPCTCSKPHWPGPSKAPWLPRPPTQGTLHRQYRTP